MKRALAPSDFVIVLNRFGHVNDNRQRPSGKDLLNKSVDRRALIEMKRPGDFEDIDARTLCKENMIGHVSLRAAAEKR